MTVFAIAHITISRPDNPGDTLALTNTGRAFALDPAGTTPRAWRRYTGRQHPRLTRMHTAYGHRKGHRR